MKKIFLICIIIPALAGAYVYYLFSSEMTGKIMRWMSGHDVSVDLSGQRPSEDAETIERGRAVYEKYCPICHGEKGDGRNRMAVNVKTKPRDFTGGIYKFRSTPTGSLPTDNDIYLTISRGLRGTAMLPWFGLSTSDKWAVTYYIKTLSERFTDEEPDAPVSIPQLPDTWKDAVNRGLILYGKAKCRDCHGRTGDGDGPKADELKDDRGLPIRPRSFLRESFKRGPSIEDVYLSITTGLDGTPMASYDDAMTNEERLATAAYVHSIAGRRPRKQGGMLEMVPMTPDERAGMMIYYPSIPVGMMRYGMMRE